MGARSRRRTARDQARAGPEGAAEPGQEGAVGGHRDLRSPSGFAYAVAAARALRDALPFQAPAHDDGADALLHALARAVREARPDRDEPSIAVVTDGAINSAQYEHKVVAAHLGALLLGPWLAGEIAIVNGFGTGVADDKLVHAYVEEMIGFYLGEDPVVRSVATLDLTRDENLRRLLDTPREYVVKPRRGQGGGVVVVCAHAAEEDVRRCLEEVRERPEEFVAQPLIELSTVPTVVGDRLVPRHVDLRPCVFSAPGWTQAVACGLTRVAWTEGALVVNSSQDGGGKVTWALR